MEGMESKPVIRNDPDYYEIKNLRLDNHNPRIPPEIRGHSQIELLIYMEERFDLLPIARSMSDNGYFDEEPLVIIPNPDEAGTFTVIEGNRRLAALKFLTDPELRTRSNARTQYAKLAENAVENLLAIPAVRYEDRDQTKSMLGFRHISGIMKWSAISKARFVQDYIRNRRDLDFAQIARILGDSTGVIRRNYATFRIYLQAETIGYDVSKVEKNFSIFYTAIGRVPFQQYLGFRIAGGSVDSFETPIQPEFHENLKQIIQWVHGDDTIGAAISDSRDLKYLAAVLTSDDALSYLKAGGRLLDAFSLTVTEEQSVIDSYQKASFHIEESLRFLHRHKANADIRKVIERCAESFAQALSHFPEIKAEYFENEEG